MLISGKSKFTESPFTSEDELREMAVENASYFFGSSSFCLSGELLSGEDGFEEFIDGFAVDISNRQWFIINVAIGKLNIWSQIVPKVVKQLVTANKESTMQLLIELITKRLREDNDIMKKFNDEGYGKEDEGVFLDEIRGVLEEVFSNTPIIGMPIDSVSDDLRNWSETLKSKVKFCVVKQYVESGNPKNVIYQIPDEHIPESEPKGSGGGNGNPKNNNKSAKITKDSLNAREIHISDRQKKVLV